MKSGFTLIELIITIAISAIVGTVLTALINQTSNYQAAVENKTSIHMRAAIALHQIERDIMGACIPVQNSMQHEKTSKEESPSEKEKASKEESVKPIERVFYIEQSKENLTLFTWITDNPMQVYWSKQVGKAKPKIARVVYALEPEENDKKSFVLKRQEDSNLDLKAYSATQTGAIRAYEVIDGIRSCTVQCTVFIYPEESKQKDGKKAQPSERTVEKRDAWEWPLHEKASDKKDVQEIPLPHLVTITLELWDDLRERSTEFIYTMAIMAEVSLEKKEEKQSKEVSTQKTDETKSSSNKTVFMPSFGSGPQISFAPKKTPSFSLGV